MTATGTENLPVRSIAPSRVLAWLCHYANADPSWNKSVFYGLKTRLLRKYATFAGHSIQEITKECWGDQRDEYGDLCGCGPSCTRCGGSGIWDRRWVRLERWDWCGYLFHVPSGTTWKKPDSVQIHGVIEHADYGRASREAELWLYALTFQWKSFWDVLTTSGYCNPGWYPMCQLQRIAIRTRKFVKFQTCWECGNRYWFRKDGTVRCSACRNNPDSTNDDVPF